MHPAVRWLPPLFVALAALLALLTATTVDLTPKVDERFFFSADSPAFREAHAIQQRFLSRQLLVVTAHAPDIGTPAYSERIARLTEKLGRLRHVLSVSSLAEGPEGLTDARASPLWRRLLLLRDVPATNLVMAVDDREPRALIDAVTRVLRAEERPDFRLTLAGVPYVVDAIARNLQDDFRRFTLAAFAVFGVLIAVLFRSWAVLIGSFTACATAAFLTLLVQQALGGRLGLLTANLVTIAFVLTQSHVVFMTNNWRQLRRRGGTPEDTLRVALAHTVRASSACMAAALLGFGSLLYVEAQPLRELGYGGTLATLSAIVAAYVVYPPFLLWAQPAAVPQTAPPGRLRLPGVPRARAAAAALAAALALGIGAVLLDTDPSLLDYFDRKSDVYQSLESIDPHGGSSPLNLAVRRADGQRLDSDESYQKMWQLQRALQADPGVGTVLSLPVLMAEAERSFLASLLPWNWLLDLLSRPTFDRVAKGFVNEDRTQALYLLRMVEGDRRERRTQVIERLERTVAQQGFETVAVGGIYALQGRLADLVLRSLVEGLVGLLAGVALIAFLVTRSLPASLAMLACTATVPTVALGLFGAARIPLDIIATPGVNVAIGVAVDSMIHLGAAWRRARPSRPARLALAEAQREQAGGIVAFTLVVIAGFAIFAASSFPPTQRFGLSVIIGAAVAGAMALWVFPALLQGRGARSGRGAPRLQGQPPAA
jgi:predicted RND superfamily exporter protein